MAATEILSEVIGSVWKIEKAQGDSVAEGELIMILESMKMEIPVDAPKAGKVTKILVSKDDVVSENQVVAIMEA